jgi:hypothetical protein
MSFVQEILQAVSADLMYEHNYDNLIKGLSEIPECYHEDFVRAYFKREPEQPEEQPEDYLAAKTFTSNEFHIGDEIVVCNGSRGIYIGRDFTLGYCLLYPVGGVGLYADKDGWTRTGRNFPAIPAILEELKKA